ncbi:hypothetical protein AX17_001190 [Amanita inopinata Kibby_2008]|nr:hypothetical protein AX17_001190 [Amanita inopinata Kibby_2008]
MIQQTNIRQHISAQIGPIVQENTNGGPEQWGIWVGRKYYSLEVVQHPIRARMCGFGDKDRRPLAPAAVAKMVVKRDDNTVIESDEVDCSFFLVTVDLWSADGKQEMNLVLHPSSVDRYVPTNLSKSRRRGTSNSAQQPRSSGNQTPTGQSTPTPTQYRSGEQQSSCVNATQIPPSQMQNYYVQPMTDGVGYQDTGTYGTSAPETSPSWAYTQAPMIERGSNSNYSPQALPSVQSFSRDPGSVSAVGNASSESWNTDGGESSVLSYRNWDGDSYSIHQYPTSSQQHDEYDAPPSEHSVYAPVTYNPPPSTVTAPASQAAPPFYASAQTQQNPPSSAHTVRHSYTRTLVGPLSANACRLLDEHRKPGMFFLFQDLSVRTEGTFRLRMRLMNIGAPPAPEAGATEIHTDVSPVLAQTFTEPFTVYSAKRFPGVPDTTALSIALGNQGQKLPLRNRHSKRRRLDDSDSDEADSDEA